MSVCGQTEDDSASEEVGPPPVRDIYKPKAVSKVVRLLTVFAYLFSVSLAAILLSVYYICVWKSPELPVANSTDGVMSAQRGNPYYDGALLQSRGGNSTIDEPTASTPVNFSTSIANTSEGPDSVSKELESTVSTYFNETTSPELANVSSDFVSNTTENT